MKLVLFNDFVPGVIVGDTVVDISEAVADVPHIDAQTWMNGIIENFDSLKSGIETLSQGQSGVPLGQVRLRAPLPEPRRLVCMAGNYMENGSRALVGDRDAFIKSSSSVIGDGDTVVLPDCPAPHFHHESELGIVIGKTADHVSADQAADNIFGYVQFIDVSARGIEPNGNNSFFWGKSWDTFGPMGPAIVTADEVDPQNLDIKLWVSGDLRQDLSTTDMGRSVYEVVEFVSWITTLKAGDVVSSWTNHVGLGPIQDGDTIEMEISGFGPKLKVNVKDDWKRTWPREPLSRMTDFESTIRSKIS